MPSLRRLVALGAMLAAALAAPAFAQFGSGSGSGGGSHGGSGGGPATGAVCIDPSELPPEWPDPCSAIKVVMQSGLTVPFETGSEVRHFYTCLTGPASAEAIQNFRLGTTICRCSPTEPADVDCPGSSLCLEPASSFDALSCAAECSENGLTLGTPTAMGANWLVPFNVCYTLAGVTDAHVTLAVAASVSPYTPASNDDSGVLTGAVTCTGGGSLYQTAKVLSAAAGAGTSYDVQVTLWRQSGVCGAVPDGSLRFELGETENYRFTLTPNGTISGFQVY